MKVIKRDGRAVEYNREKIYTAIEKANSEVNEKKRANKKEIEYITNYIESLDKKRILVEDIQDIIEEKLMELGKYDLSKKYIVYRYTRALVRKQNTTDESILSIIKNINNVSEDEKQTSIIVSMQRDLIAGEVSKDLTRRILLPGKIIQAHDEGILYFHDMEYFLQPIIESCIINIGDMLDNGICINNQNIKQPEDFKIACIIFSQIISLIISGQYGELCVNIKHLGKYLRKSYEKILLDLDELYNENLSKKIAQKKCNEELVFGIQVIQYQINSLLVNYSKSHMVTLILELDDRDEYYMENLMIITQILTNRMEIMKKSDIENTCFLKIICDFKIENNNDLSNLLKLAEQCNCIINPSNMQKYECEGHFSYGKVSIILPQIVNSMNGSEENFWKLLDERLEICYEALMCRHYALLGTISNVSPIHWQNGGIARLQVGERIDKLLKDGYSDISLVCVGLEQTTKSMASIFNWDEITTEKFKNKLAKYLEDRVRNWKKMTGIGFMLQEDVENTR